MSDVGDPANPWTPRKIWDEGGLSIEIRRTLSGGVQFETRELGSATSGDSATENIIFLSDDDTWDLKDAVNGTDDDLLERIEPNAETIARMGVTGWLESLGITSHRVLSAGSSFAEDRFSGAVNNTSTREVWNKGGLYVSVSRTLEGGVRFDGQDLNPNPFGDSDYEYSIIVRRGDVPNVIEVLGGQPDADPLDVIEANIETIMRQGEMTWLKSKGIEPGFWS